MKSNLPLTNTISEQISPLGRPYRQIATSIDGSKPQKWINKEFRSCWKWLFKFLDEQGGYLKVTQDWYGKIEYEKIKTPCDY